MSISRPVKIIGVAIILVVGLLVFSVGPSLFNSFTETHTAFEMKGDSMLPNYKDGQFWITENYSSGKLVSRGDVMVYKDPQTNNKEFMKRIIGISGDSILLQNGDVYINGQKLDEPYVNGTRTDAGEFIKEGEALTVPDRNYLLLGDNRPYSFDSRIHGFVPEENLISKVTTCYKNCD